MLSPWPMSCQGAPRLRAGRFYPQCVGSEVLYSHRFSLSRGWARIDIYYLYLLYIIYLPKHLKGRFGQRVGVGLVKFSLGSLNISNNCLFF